MALFAIKICSNASLAAFTLLLLLLFNKVEKGGVKLKHISVVKLQKMTKFAIKYAALHLLLSLLCCCCYSPKIEKGGMQWKCISPLKLQKWHYFLQKCNIAALVVFTLLRLLLLFTKSRKMLYAIKVYLGIRVTSNDTICHKKCNIASLAAFTLLLLLLFDKSRKRWYVITCISALKLQQMVIFAIKNATLYLLLHLLCCCCGCSLKVVKGGMQLKCMSALKLQQMTQFAIKNAKLHHLLPLLCCCLLRVNESWYVIKIHLSIEVTTNTLFSIKMQHCISCYIYCAAVAAVH